jgi:predicted PurR-regulated permease PerM
VAVGAGDDVTTPEAVTLDGGPRTLRFTPGSVLRAILMVAAVVVAIAIFRSATRPLGWLAVAVIGAALLGPLVGLLDRALPRVLAVIASLLLVLLPLGAIVYASVDDMGNELDRVQRISRRAAGELERSERFGEFAREINLRERVDQFMDELPNRLRGGSQVEAIQSAASRGVSFLITGVLMLFLLTWGPRFFDGALAQVSDVGRRLRVRNIVLESYGRWWRYVAATTGRAVLAGIVTWAVVVVADLPGPVLLAVWVGAWSVVPAVGVFVGSWAVALVAVPQSFSLAGWLLVLFLGYQIADVLLLERVIDAKLLHLGSFGTFVAAALGLEAYGLGGLIVTLLVAMFAAALVRTITTRDVIDASVASASE